MKFHFVQLLHGGKMWNGPNLNSLKRRVILPKRMSCRCLAHIDMILADVTHFHLLLVHESLQSQVVV